ncbi:hypothetical protein ACHAXR_012698 [Thalassiosira sp. AJA248-18]
MTTAIEPSNCQYLQSSRTAPKITHEKRRRRPRTTPSNIATLVIMRNTFLLLLCTHRLFCHSFVIVDLNSIASAMKKTISSSPSTTTTCNAKEEGDDIQDEESWEWDGVVVEGAHDDEFEAVDNDPADIFVPSASFMSMASSVTSPALTAVSSDGSGSGSGATKSGELFDPLKNSGKLHRMELMEEGEMSADDLLQNGGDPFFLDDKDDVVGKDGGMSEEEMDDLLDMGGDPAFFGWDGTVDEDAHNDFD